MTGIEGSVEEEATSHRGADDLKSRTFFVKSVLPYLLEKKLLS